MSSSFTRTPSISNTSQTADVVLIIFQNLSGDVVINLGRASLQWRFLSSVNLFLSLQLMSDIFSAVHEVPLRDCCFFSLFNCLFKRSVSRGIQKFFFGILFFAIRGTNRSTHSITLCLKNSKGYEHRDRCWKRYQRQKTANL